MELKRVLRASSRRTCKPKVGTLSIRRRRDRHLPRPLCGRQPGLNAAVAPADLVGLLQDHVGLDLEALYVLSKQLFDARGKFLWGASPTVSSLPKWATGYP